MPKIGFIGIGCLFLGIAINTGLAAGKIISCPALSLRQYGKLTYFDPKIGRTWNLQWMNQQVPVWSSVSIPKTTACGTGRSNNGIPITYQCAVFECKSNAVVASLQQNQSLKCFSAYASTGNTFYCNTFSANQ